VIFERPSSDAPFEEMHRRGFDHLSDVRLWSGKPPAEALEGFPNGEPPDVVVVASWGALRYLRAAIELPRSCTRLVAVDSPWRGSAKQWAGRVSHRRLLARAFDGAWIAGEPQWQLVHRLGFTSARVFEHLYCCDTDLFKLEQPRSRPTDSPFLFAGRLVNEKAVSELVTAFSLFRRETKSNRGLLIVGNGPVRVSAEGVEVMSFSDPPKLRELMKHAYAFINPARIEHWGVAVHEAAAMGLPLILSRNVGAGTRFLIEGVNGLHAGPDVQSLSGALAELDAVGPERYLQMSQTSADLGSMLDLDRWVTNFESGVTRVKSHVRATQ